MTEVATVTMAEADARWLTERIRVTAHTYAEAREKLIGYVEQAKAGNAHLALGYRSWTEYLSEVLGEEPMRLARDERREVVQLLSAEGMSTRAIAPIVGAGQSTVSDDLRAGDRNRSPDPEPADPEADLSMRPDGAAALNDDPAPAPKVTGRDGKEYSKPTPKAEPSKPRRAPLPDAFFKAAYDLRKNVERLERLVDDDRFPQNREQVALRHENDLTRTAEALTGVLRAINNR